MARDPLTLTWSGRIVEQARAIVVTWLPAPCGQCGKTVTKDDAWVVGHIKPRATHPELALLVSNWQPEHRSCSDRTGQSVVIAKAKAEAIRDLSDATTRAEPPPLPVSPPEHQDEAEDDLDQPALPGIAVTVPDVAAGPVTVNPDLLWDPERLAEYPWLTELVLNIPDDANPPLWMTPPATAATGSFGAAAIEFIEREHRMSLRWWQKLAITRQLEHDAGGRLICETYLESAPRRAGKSVRMRGMATWRLADPLGIFGEVQLVMHTGNDLATCREIQRGAWKWAESIGWTVTRANGKEAIETLDDDRWLTRSQDAVYGYDVCLAMVDEAWDVKPETVADGLEPAMLDRIMPQLSITSTAHPRTTSLMPTYIVNALTTTDPSVIIILWGVDPARLADVTPQQRVELLADPALWKAASPYWSDARATYIASKWDKARAAKPTPDNPDPIRTFEKQYLNVWTLDMDTSLPGEPVVEPAVWKGLELERPDGPPVRAAIESWFSAGVSLVLGWLVDGRVVVSSSDHATVAEAVAAMRAAGYRRRRVLVGKSLLDHPAMAGVPKTPKEARTGGAAAELKRLLREDVVRHDGSSHLTEQVVDVRTVDGSDGPRVVSKTRADAVKAAVWVVAGVRATTAKRSVKVLVANG